MTFQSSVGDRVLIDGTGRWWSGSRFVAFVADVDVAAGTIKVKYSDGGYKRFTRGEYSTLVARARSYHQEVHEPQLEDSITGVFETGTVV